MTKANTPYFIDPKNAAEMARLLMQDRLYTQAMREHFPEPVLTPASRILDIGCGPGGWLIDLIKESIQGDAKGDHSHTGVGVDSDRLMLQYARSQAEAWEIKENLSFEEMDLAVLPWPFPDGSFDLVNSRLMGFFPPTLWQQMIREMVRVTRPGGVVRLTETEMTVSNQSPALEREMEWFFQALYRSGRSHSTNGHRLTITASLAPLLRRSGLQNVQFQAYGIEWSYGTEAYETKYEDMRLGLKLLEPFYVATGVATQAEIDETYAQMLEQMRQPEFAAVQYFLTAQGEK